MFEGIGERLQKEIEARAPKSVSVEVAACPERKYAVWRGGSVVTSLCTFSCYWTTKEEYDEAGSAKIIRI